MGTEVLLYIPNIIGYVRIILIFAATAVISRPVCFITLYCMSALLDGVDGLAARRLNQISAFGAWLDVIVDLISRGMIWCVVCQDWGYYVAALEWTTFVCTHSRGSEWKSSFEEAPWFVKMVMAKGFKTPMGFLAVGSLHVLPVWLYTVNTDLQTELFRVPLMAQYAMTVVLVAGRLLCMSVEIYCIIDYVLSLLNKTTTNNGKNNEKTTDNESESNLQTLPRVSTTSKSTKP